MNIFENIKHLLCFPLPLNNENNSDSIFKDFCFQNVSNTESLDEIVISLKEHANNLPIVDVFGNEIKSNF